MANFYRTLANLSVRRGDSEDFDDLPAGTVTSAIPDVSVGWLQEQGYIVPAADPSAAVSSEQPAGPTSGPATTAEGVDQPPAPVAAPSPTSDAVDPDTSAIGD